MPSHSLNRQIFRLAIPSTLTAIVEPVISFTDKSVASHFDNDFISAIGMTTNLLAILVWGCGSIRGVIINKTAVLYGKNKLTNKADSINSIFITGIILTIFLVLISAIFTPLYLQIFNYSDTLKSQAQSYLLIRLLGVPLLVFIMFCSSFLRGKQNATSPFIIALSVAVLNVILDLLLPSYFSNPLVGIAWASFIAQLIGAVIALMIIKDQLVIKFKKKNLFNSELILSLKASFLLFQRTLLLHGVIFFYQKMISTYNIQLANEYNLLLEIWLFAAFFLDGFAMAMGSLGGLYQGRHNIKELHRSFTQSSFFAFLTGIILCISLNLVLPYLLKLMAFETTSSVFRINFLIMSTSLLIAGLAFVVDGAAIGTGQNTYLRNLMLRGLFFFLLAFGALHYLFPSYKYYHLWISMIIWLLSRSSLILGAYRRILKA